MFRRLTLISLLLALASVFMPALTQSADAAPSGEIATTIGNDFDSVFTGNDAELLEHCQDLANKIDWARWAPWAQAIGKHFGVQRSTVELLADWDESNCQQFRLPNAPK